MQSCLRLRLPPQKGAIEYRFLRRNGPRNRYPAHRGIGIGYNPVCRIGGKSQHRISMGSDDRRYHPYYPAHRTADSKSNSAQRAHSRRRRDTPLSLPRAVARRNGYSSYLPSRLGKRYTARKNIRSAGGYQAVNNISFR